MTRKVIQHELDRVAPAVLRALIREKVHHALETAVELYAAKGKPASPAIGAAARQLLDEWDRRGLTEQEPDLEWVKTWLQITDTYIRTRQYHNPPHPPALPPEQLRGLQRAIVERRSVRIWRDEAVSDHLLDRLLEAAAWAPSACNQQPVRFIVVRDRQTIAMIPGDGCFEMAPVIVVVLLDRRSHAYLSGIPDYNPVLDAGAAIQNMLLMAFGLGLSTTWGTFTSGRMSDAVRERLGVPDHLEMLTYVAVGFPADFPPAPGRLRLPHLVAYERWSEQVDVVGSAQRAGQPARESPRPADTRIDGGARET